MKERFSPAAGYVLLFVLLATSSCKKVIDEIIKHPNGAADNCRITRVTSLVTQYNMMDTASFTYNAKGAPVSITHTISDKFIENTVYSADQYFGYYPDGRLAAYLSEASRYGENMYTALTWQKFTYPASNIVIDSVFHYANGFFGGSFTPIYPSTALQIIYKMELDSYGRIVKYDTYYPDGQHVGSESYSYDSNGNKVVPGVTYNTSKHNLRQTHKVWMFVSNDYSVNSPTDEATSYNSKKLPENVHQMPSFIFRNANYPGEFTNIKFTYQCK